VVDEDQKAVVIADRSEVPFLRRKRRQRQSMGELANGCGNIGDADPYLADGERSRRSAPVIENGAPSEITSSPTHLLDDRQALFHQASGDDQQLTDKFPGPLQNSLPQNLRRAPRNP
jgi:hypothetical protein